MEETCTSRSPKSRPRKHGNNNIGLTTIIIFPTTGIMYKNISGDNKLETSRGNVLRAKDNDDGMTA